MKPVTLESIGGGALKELFNAEMDRVMGNIRDINTDPAQKRTITMTVEFKPDAKREGADVKLKCKSSLAGIMTVKTVREHLSAIHMARLASLTPEQKRERVAAAGRKRKPGYNSGWRHSEKSKAAIGAANKRIAERKRLERGA